MTAPSPLTATARRLQAALRHETGLARRGAVSELAAAAEAKRLAFCEFHAACAAPRPADADLAGERDVLRALLAAADENANMLEAVRATLEQLSDRLRAALSAAVDPGTYTLKARRGGHVPAARLDASA